MTNNNTGTTDAGPRPDATPGEDTGVQPSVSFQEQVIDDQVVHGQGVEVVDFEGDGDNDVLVSLSLTDAVHLYLNNGNGTSWDRTVVGSNIVAMETVSVDLDGDNDRDVAAVGLFDRNGGFNSAGEVTWYRNDGGTFTAQPITGLSFWAPIYIEAADLTGDDLPELVVGSIFIPGSADGNGVYWFRNTGSGFEGPFAVEANFQEVKTVFAVDVDGNGVQDVLALGKNSNEVVWWENGRTAPGDPTFTRRVIATPNQPVDMWPANMDDDADLELVVAISGGVVYYDRPADVRQTWPEIRVTDQLGDPEDTRIFAADFDRDGRTDVAVASTVDDGLQIFLQGDGSFAGQSVQAGYNGLNFLRGGDLDGDQRPDLVTSTYREFDGSVDDTLSWWKNEMR